MLKAFAGIMRKGQEGITGLETAIILIACVVVASVFTATMLSAGFFTMQKSQETGNAGLQEIQSTMVIQGGLIAYKDTLNTGGSGSIGKMEFTVTLSSDGNPIDLTPAYTIDPVSGALTDTNPSARLQIAFTDANITIPDSAWTVSVIGNDNGDYVMDSGGRAVITVWLHTFDGTNWGPAASEGLPFLGTNYVDTQHTFTLEVKSAHGAVLTIERTTRAYLDPVNDLH